MRSCRPVRATAAGLLCVLAAATPAAAQDTRVSAGSPPARSRRTSRTSRRSPSTPRTRTSWRPAPTTTSTWRPATPATDNTARSPRASACRASTSRSTAARPGSQPTYTGLSARDCTRVLGDADPLRRRRSARSARCRTTTSTASSPTATRRWRSARSGATARFSWANGSRLYYANLTSQLPGRRAVQGLRGDRRLAHRRRPAAAAGGDQAPGATRSSPASRTRAQFSDKEQIWADNAAVEPLLRQRLRLLRRVPRQRQRASRRSRCSC